VRAGPPTIPRVLGSAVVPWGDEHWQADAKGVYSNRQPIVLCFTDCGAVDHLRAILEPGGLRFDAIEALVSLPEGAMIPLQLNSTVFDRMVLAGANWTFPPGEFAFTLVE